MNRYFWLLMRFITDDQSAAERRELYDRARTAFLEQLANARPPLPNGVAAFERLSFEEAIRIVEANVARWGRQVPSA